MLKKKRYLSISTYICTYHTEVKVVLGIVSKCFCLRIANLTKRHFFQDPSVLIYFQLNPRKMAFKVRLAQNLLADVSSQLLHEFCKKFDSEFHCFFILGKIAIL
jgi:hypothetical protein